MSTCVLERPTLFADEPPPARAPRVWIGIDPGPTQSAFCLYRPDHAQPLTAGTVLNAGVLELLRSAEGQEHLAIELIASYGMPVGREVFDTCIWIGRFIEAWGRPHTLVTRLEVKMHLCHDSRAKDPNIRRALLDRFGEPGTKKAPGRTYGLAGDQWSALAVAVTCADKAGATR